MNRNFFNTLLLTLVLAAFCAADLSAQTVSFPQPRQEKLLNGLKVLIWKDPSAAKATIRLRIHNGAAFDPKDKMGVMALLSDILFPSAEAKAYFTEDLEGSLDISSNYDYLQISATGKPDELQAMLETISNAVINTQVTDEAFASVRKARAEKVSVLEKNAVYVADRAAAQRLFGEFPYGRSSEGTAVSLTKIDKVDLMRAHDRFFTADNATLAIGGNINPDFAYRAARRLFGAWKKSETKTPATFRLPDAPSADVLTVNFPESEQSISRLVIPAAARNDKDFYATKVLAKIWQEQFCLDKTATDGISNYSSYLLRGVYAVNRNATPVSTTTGNTANGCRRFAPEGKITLAPITQAQFDAAKASVKANFQNSAQNNLIDLWLDIDTYKLVSVNDELKKIDVVTLADAQRVAENLQKQTVVSVVVKRAN